jgi:galactose mutarotase-like enzyme
MKSVLQSPKITAVVNFFGAEICSIKNAEGLEFIWQGNKDIWPRHAPVLFPIVGKLKDNAFKFNNSTFSLGQHGFARDMEFSLLDQTQNSCTFELRSCDQTKKAFPFDFVFQINYTLDQNTLVTNYKVLNPSAETIYFSVGAHPGFNCPLLPTEKFEDYYLQFETSSPNITELNGGLRSASKKPLKLTDKKLAITANLFDNDALVFEDSQINQISLCSAKSNHKISLSCKNWPYFGIWSKKGNTDFVCLEPWYGIADIETTKSQFTNKEGIIQLAPKMEFNSSFSLTFD